MNEAITRKVLESAIEWGVTDFVVCPAGRNAPFVDLLRTETQLSIYYWPEERSAAFFALGISRRKQRPVAIVVTSGTAAGELLPAAMEAYYSGVPLMLITADRPRRFRGSGAPQSAEQIGLFGPYAQFSLDIDEESGCSLCGWSKRLPIHLNVCLEEPQRHPVSSGVPLKIKAPMPDERLMNSTLANDIINTFLFECERPLVIVSTLPSNAKEQVVKFLLKLKAPVFLEGISGIREEASLQPLRVKSTENILEIAKSGGYSIDSILRIGGVPTNRIWRDIENLQGSIKVCSLSHLPFPGLSWNSNLAYVDIEHFLVDYQPARVFGLESAQDWLYLDDEFSNKIIELYKEEPLAEPSLINELSKNIPKGSHVYLGNSLPIREWDLAACQEDRKLEITASRGVNGIDGQIATFLGLCRSETQNWAILGDLTALYDMAGCWGLSLIEAAEISIVIINNGGGKIFERMFPHPEMLNQHGLSFEPLARMWGLPYQCLKDGINGVCSESRQLIEIIPDHLATQRFWSKLTSIKEELVCCRPKV